MVAQVGTNIGARMEESHRAAQRLTGRLTPSQLADLYVRLKGAIGGDFYVVEAGPRRIVLGNRRCPFGDVVRAEPGLCRMTSSVFGGIAARNRDGAAVVLEERIALGDPECRVVVWLDDAPRPEARTCTRRPHRRSRPIPISSKRAAPRCAGRTSSTRRRGGVHAGLPAPR